MNGLLSVLERIITIVLTTLVLSFMLSQTLSTATIGKGCLLLLAFGRAFNSLSRELTLSNAMSFGYWHLIFLTINDLALMSLEEIVKKDQLASQRTSLSRRYFQPESGTTSTSDKEFILQLL